MMVTPAAGGVGFQVESFHVVSESGVFCEDPGDCYFKFPVGGGMVWFALGGFEVVVFTLEEGF